MDSISASTATRPPHRPARQRILEAATRLFYAEGIRAVGVDRIVAEAGVTKATFYHSFHSKDELVRAYLEDEHRAHRDKFEAEIARHSDPLEAILALFDRIGDGIFEPGFRGCSFLNTATEYPDPSQPVAAVIAIQRTWLHDRFASLLMAAGNPQP